MTQGGRWQLASLSGLRPHSEPVIKFVKVVRPLGRPRGPAATLPNRPFMAMIWCSLIL